LGFGLRGEGQLEANLKKSMGGGVLSRGKLEGGGEGCRLAPVRDYGGGVGEGKEKESRDTKVLVEGSGGGGRDCDYSMLGSKQEEIRGGG